MTATDSPRRPSKWLIEHYDEIVVLGKGAQGSVVLSRSKRTKELVAIKKVQVNAVHASKMTEREARFLSVLKMRNITRLEDWYMTSTEYVLIMEACDWDLFQYMDMYNQKKLKLPQLFVWSIFSRIADALAFIHHSGIVHHDMKPPNILLRWGDRNVKTEYPEPILADFGAATQDSERNYDILAAPAYTMLYHPPDSLRGPTMDIWGLGSIIHEIALGRTVIKSMPAEVSSDPLAREIWVKSADNKMIGRGVDQIYSPQLEKLMTSCLRFSPANRITSKDLSREARNAWRDPTQLVPFQPLESWCCDTVKAKAARESARKAGFEKVDAERAARPRPKLPEPTETQLFDRPRPETGRKESEDIDGEQAARPRPKLPEPTESESFHIPRPLSLQPRLSELTD